MRAWYGLALLLLASACGSIEEVTSEGSLRGEAGINPLLATQRFLERMGLPAESTNRLPLTYPQGGVVLVSGQRFRAPSPALERFLQWVAGGGQALVFLDGFDEKRFPQVIDSDLSFALLDRLGVERGPGFADRPESEYAPSENGPRTVDEYDLLLDTSAGLVGPVGEELQPVFRLDHGSGSLVLVPEGSILARKRLGESDHAAWLWTELRAGPRAPASALLIHGGKDSLWSLLTKHVPAAPWALLGLVVLALWRLAVRFGPTLAEPPPARLGFDLHVAAVGRFLWKRGQRQALVQAWRERVLQAARPKLGLPLPAGSDPTRVEGFAKALRERSQIPEDRIQRAFHSEHFDEPETFAAIVADLQALCQAL